MPKVDHLERVLIWSDRLIIRSESVIQSRSFRKRLLVLFDYTVTQSDLGTTGPPARCSRNAVLWPLASGEARRKRDTCQAYSDLVSRWRARLRSLSRGGWSVVATDQDLITALNCPPFSVVVPARGFTCQRSRVCPMCYARNLIMPVFDAIAWALIENQQSAIKLVVTRTEQTRDFTQTQELVDYIAALDSLRNADLQDFTTDSMGSITAYNVAPGINPGNVSVVWSTFVAVPLRSKVSEDSDILRTVTASELTYRQLGSLVSWSLGYPRGLMFGDAYMAVQIANAFTANKSRHYACRGMFRNRGVRHAFRKQRPQTVVTVE
jgi:hypothetical protein